jgi:hypothetical protein
LDGDNENEKFTAGSHRSSKRKARYTEYLVKLPKLAGKWYSSIERQIETDVYEGHPMGSPVEMGIP